MTRLGWAGLAICAAGVLGCGDDDGVAAGDAGPGPGADAGTRDGGAVDAGETADSGGTSDAEVPLFDAGEIAFTDAGALVCRDAGLADYSRLCTIDDDCAVAMHMLDCCGSLFAFGISASEVARFTSDEAACETTYPACGCAAGPTLVEDGTTLGGKSAAVARCAGGTCRAMYLPLP